MIGSRRAALSVLTIDFHSIAFCTVNKLQADQPSTDARIRTKPSYWMINKIRSSSTGLLWS
jgi:hypothetical protein